MAMNSVYSKGNVQNPNGGSSAVHWWSGLGSQPPSSYGDESFSQLKSSSLEHHPNIGGDLLNSPKQRLDNGNTTQFTIFPGDHKSSAPPEYRGQLGIRFGQPVICAKYPYGDQCYGVFSTYTTQIPGRIMLPLNLSNDEGPVFVNAKQYHGIMRRRKSRAKAEMENKVLRARKPYMHRSRHLHAMRRPRGTGGRFLNTKNSNGDKGKTVTKDKGKEQPSQPTGSQNSEVLQSDSWNLNSPREAANRNGSNREVTSMYYSGNALNPFLTNRIMPPVNYFAGALNSNWTAAAADSGCNLKV